jgi:hypothetical protein
VVSDTMQVGFIITVIRTFPKGQLIALCCALHKLLYHSFFLFFCKFWPSLHTIVSPPVLILVIFGSVVGGVLGSRSSNFTSASNSTLGNVGSDATASFAASVKLEVGRFAIATNSTYMMLIYPSTVSEFNNKGGIPTFICIYRPTLLHSHRPHFWLLRTPHLRGLKTHFNPRFLAFTLSDKTVPGSLLPPTNGKHSRNDTIFANAADHFSKQSVAYFLDGDSGISDNAREVKMRIKAFAYAYHITNDTKWVDCTWAEVQVGFSLHRRFQVSNSLFTGCRQRIDIFWTR